MRTRHLLTVLALALSALHLATTPGRAERIEYEISGTVRDPLPSTWPIHFGDPFRGSFFFDPDFRRSRYAIDGYAFWDILGGQAGLQIDVSTAGGIVTFANVPGYVGIELLNDFSYNGRAPFYDQFFIYCSEVTQFPVFFRRPFVQFNLQIISDNARSSFLEGTDLPSHMNLPSPGFAAVTAFGGPNFSSTDYYLVFLIDRLSLANRPPDCSAAVGRIPAVAALSGGMVPVTIEGVTDPDSDPVTIAVTGVSQDEPVVDVGARPTCPDATIEAGAAKVRMERSGSGNGRVYRVAFTASDGRGGGCDGAVTVCVPHDQGSTTCVDDGTAYDSTPPCSGAPTLAAAPEAGAELAVTPAGNRDFAFELTLQEAGEVALTIHDVAGRTVATVARGGYGAGTHRLEWRAGNQSSGIYFARLRTPSVTLVRRVAIL